VINRIENSDERPGRQGAGRDIPEPNKIGAFTPYDFEGKNLTAYGGYYRWRPCWRSLDSSNSSRERCR
jgi:hypothetical protein